MKFNQRRAFLRIESEILKNGVFYKEKDLFNGVEVEVPFEEISDRVIKVFNISKLYLCICAIFLLLFVFNLYDFYFQTSFPVNETRGLVTSGDLFKSIVWLAMASFGTWMRSVRYIGLLGSGVDLMFFSQKGDRDPKKYMDQIIVARDKYFETTYGGEEESEDGDEMGALGQGGPEDL